MEFYDRLVRTSLSINDGGRADPVVFGAAGAFDNFGELFLDRCFEPVSRDPQLPRIEDFIREGVVRIDSYRQALWNYYSTADWPVFTLDVVDERLVPDEHIPFVFASSCQHMDPQTGELISPKKAAVIISRSTFDERKGDEYNLSRAHLLAYHELGHLVVGTKVCDDQKCVFSHPKPEDREKALEEKVDFMMNNNRMYICAEDVRRMEEFRRRLSG